MSLKEKSTCCTQLEAKVKALCNGPRPSLSKPQVLDTSHTIGAEEKPNKLNPELGQLKRTGELAERVMFWDWNL